MIQEFKQTFIDGIDIDSDESKVNPTAAVFIKNMTANLNVNPDSDALSGSNRGVYTPLESNVALAITLPAGVNYCCGFYSAEETNEGYAFVYNSNTDHVVYLINSIGICTKVFQGAELPFKLLPEFFICEGMCTLFTKSYIDPATKLETEFKFLIFTNDNIQQYFLSVTDSIATNSFTTSYFAGAGTLYDRTTLFHLGVPTPIDCIKITKVAPVSGDETKQNLMIRTSWEFRVKNYDVWGRPSLHGKISTPYMVLIGGGGCLTTSNNLSRCVDLEFDAGNPLVDRIDIEYRKPVDAIDGEPVMSAWFKYDTIYRWDNSTGVPWYARAVNPHITYNATTNKITTRFCADKNCAPVDPVEAALVEPGLPRLSHNVVAVNKNNCLGNNTRGFQPVAPDKIAAVTYSFIPPSGGTICDPPPMREIEVYVEIINPFRTQLIIVRQMPYGGGVVGFGIADCGSDNPTQYDQVFPGKTNNEGFPAYMAGMNGGAYAVTTEQVDFDPSTGTATWLGTHSFTSKNFVLQRIKMKVPAGKYILRLGSHKAKITDADFQKTSTAVLGLSTIANITNWYNYYNNPMKEIEIDCTSGDVIYKNSGDPIFVVMDMSYVGGGSAPCLFPNRTMAVDGYLVEDQVGGNNTPIEMNPVLFEGSAAGGGGVTASYGSFFTDHNGYFFASTKGLYMNVRIQMDDCSGNTLFYHQGPGGNGIKHGDGSGSGSFADVQGNWKNKVSLYTGTTPYPDSGRRHIKGKIALCSDATIGVPGIPVVMTKGAYAVTDANGNYEIIAHNRYNYVTFYTGTTTYVLPAGSSVIPNYSTSPNNQDKLIYSQKGGCAFTACGGCTYSVANAVIAYLGCGGSRVTTVTTLQVNIPGVNIFGIQSGGKYPVGFVLYDKIGRRTYVQVAEGDAQYVIAPNLNDVGYRQFALGQIGFSIAGGTNFGSEFTHMSFFVAGNTMFRDYISLPADWIQFVDSTGATNTTNPTQVRIYMNSLREYNKQNNYSTNCAWDILVNKDENGSPVKGDIVEFIMNGDGIWFTSVLSAQITYSQDGSFFTIDYSNDLKTLLNGALFRIIRPKNCQGNYIYYETCLTIKLVNGVPQTLSGIIPYSDSYILSRQMPVPIMAGQSGPVAPGALPSSPLQYTSSNNNAAITNYADKNINYNNVIKMTLDDSLTSYPFSFESPSPSDLWGSHVRSRGRLNVVNPNECQQRISTEICTSGVLSDRGVLNFLGYFKEEDAHVFNRNTWGAIVSMIVNVSEMMVICERDHFVVRFGNGELRVENGNVISQNKYGMFGSPERRSEYPYGCDLRDINTVKRFGSKVVWLDRTGYIIFQNFSRAIAVGGNDGYINNKISQVNLMNQNQNVNGQTYFSIGIDPKTEEVFFTTFNIPASGLPSYINDLKAIDLTKNETSIYSLNDGKFKAWVGFTPENYGMMAGYQLQKNFITFKSGIPYIHHQGVSASTISYNSFYGVQTKKMFALLVNPLPAIVKWFLFIEVFCKEHKFTAFDIKTQSGQQSNIPSALWNKVLNFWCSCYYCDVNTVFDPSRDPIVIANPFHDGDSLNGLWLKQFFVSEDVDDSKYCELTAVSSHFITMQNNEPING